MHVSILLALSASVAFSANLVSNGDFEKDLAGWSTSHSWYEQPAGAGLSALSVASGEGPGGKKALKMVGGGKRGITMQVFAAYPGRYRISGWIQCEKLEAGHAGVLAEWLDGKGTWMRGDWAVQVSGDQEWKRFETIVEAPAKTRSVHLDLLTEAPNHGTVRFHGIAMERVASNLPLPAPPVISAETPPGQEGCLRVTWDPAKLSEGIIRLLVFCEATPLTGSPRWLPVAVAGAEDGAAMVWSLENGKAYHLAAVAINGDGKSSACGAAVQATVRDRQPPRPGWLSARRVGPGRTRVEWSPHVLDADLQSIHLSVSFFAPRGKKARTEALRTVPVARLYGRPRPLFSTAPWLALDLDLPAGAQGIGVCCEDRAGNRGEVAWARIAPAADRAPGTRLPLWTLPPTAQLRQDAAVPNPARSDFSLTLLRGQAKGFQVAVRPERDLKQARVVFGPLGSEDGQAALPPEDLAWHFVKYVNLEKNSQATPAEELVWKAPADYPDELDDAPLKDLPAGKTQPIYIRLTAPADAKPGLYRGRGWLEWDRGRSQAFTFTARVAPVALPERTRLKFVYWFGWGEPCRRFGVDQSSEDGWRVLSRLGELMRAHHQNCVVVPWSLVHTWRAADGGLRHDFRDFDRYVQTFRAVGVDRQFCLSHMGGRTTGEWECPTMGSSTQTVTRLDTGETEQMDVVDLLPALQRHIEELGLLDRFAVHVADEPIPANLASYRQLSARVHAAAPKLRRMDAIHVPNLKGSLEVWVPQLNYFNQWLDQYRQAQAEGNELWFYIAWVPQYKYPNRMIDSAAIKPRVLHWLNALYDTSGYLHWALNWWDISLMSIQSPGDQYICWPSRRFIANSSLRYEAEREGLEDCELMFMLRDALMKQGKTRAQAQAAVEKIGRKAVRGFEDYTRSWEELEAVRGELIEALVAAGGR